MPPRAPQRPMLEICIHNPRQHSQFQHNGEPLVLALAPRDSALWTPVSESVGRVAQAKVQITRSEPGIQLMKVGCVLVCDNAENCDTGDALKLPVPANFSIGDTLFEIIDSRRTSEQPRRPLEKLLSDNRQFIAPESSGPGPSPATISRWFSGLGSLNRWTNSLQELYIQAAQCAVDAIGLDGATVLRRRDELWEIAASHLPHPELGIHCDVSILDELLETPQTLFHGAGEDSAQPAVVVSPLRNSAGNLVGALYGFRSVHAENARRGIRYLEANLIELLAGAVNEAVVRLERETEVDRRRLLMEQALSACPEHSSRRTASEQREVTLLFADLRRFTELAASLELEQVYELLGHVMDSLTAAVMDHDGMVIDYYGDGLAAMWNAPADQAHHPELACRAALRMLHTIPDIAADWQDLLLEELRIGIGVHTGTVQVGNAGSKRRTKYGPRGPEVHLASRVESATKELGVPLVITQPTAEQLSNRFTAHRICRARMRGLQQPIDLFTVEVPSNRQDLSAAWSAYDDALALFESGKYADAADLLPKVDPQHSLIPSQFLSDQIARALGRQHRRRSTDKGSAAQPPVITLSTK